MTGRKIRLVLTEAEAAALLASTHEALCDADVAATVFPHHERRWAAYRAVDKLRAALHPPVNRT